MSGETIYLMTTTKFSGLSHLLSKCWGLVHIVYNPHKKELCYIILSLWMREGLEEVCSPRLESLKYYTFKVCPNSLD